METKFTERAGDSYRCPHCGGFPYWAHIDYPNGVFGSKTLVLYECVTCFAVVSKNDTAPTETLYYE